MMAKPSRTLAALLCALACAACGDEPSGGAPGALGGGAATPSESESLSARGQGAVPLLEPSRRPLRLAKGAAAVSSPVWLSVTPADITAVQLLDPDSGSLRPVVVGGDGLVDSPTVIQPTRANELLVILFELDAGEAASIRARLGVGEGLVTAEPCRGLRLVRLAVLQEGESLDTIQAAGGLPHPSGRREPLGAAVLRIHRGAKDGSLARWASPPAADGLAMARFVLPQGNQRTLWAAILEGDGVRPTVLGNLEAIRKPVFEHLSDGLVIPTEGAAPAPDAHWADLKVGGEVRQSLIVSPGSAHELQVEVPVGASRLEFGVCVPPGHQPGMRSQWVVERLAPAPVELARGELTVVDEEPLRIRFEDLQAAWPPTDGGQRSARLRFRVEGQTPVAFGAPLLLGPAKSPRPPNLLLISLDTLRADHLGAYGYHRPTSPFLDAFAQEATLFTNAQTVAPYTLPSQVTMLTGLLPPSHGVIDAGTDRLDATHVPYLPGLLAGAGWVTAAFTGGGYVSADYGFAAGFDRFASVDPFLYIPAVQERMGLGAVSDWIERHADTPWFLFMHTFAVHDYRPPAEDLALFDTRTGPADERRPLARFPGPDGRKDVPPTPEQLEDMRNMYDASIHFADRMLGSLMESLQQRGLLDNTLVVITSDHGEEFGEHGGMRHARSLHREMLHVPLIIAMPGQTQGRVVREPVSLTDLMPTLLELMGVPVPGSGDGQSMDGRSLDGRSITGLLPGGSGRGGTAELPPPMLLGHIDTHTSRRSSLQVGPLKVIRGDTSQALQFPAPAAWRLYDLRADPGEQVDLSAERPEDLADLRNHLEILEAGLRARAAPGALGEVDEAVLEQLRALGYVR